MDAPISTWKPASERRLLDMTGYQWAVLFVAWCGWGLDVFDGLLFTYVAPNCVPTLLGLPIGSPQAKAATLAWVGALTSLLLIGWAAGGIIFGWLADRIGHKRALLLTMTIFSVGTALCAAAPNIWILALCRLIASIGLGGEWAAGAAMVAKEMPPGRRMEAGALLYTAAPMGLFLAAVVNYQIAGVYFKNNPAVSWRYVFLFGLLPACFALLMRGVLQKLERRQEKNAEISRQTHPRRRMIVPKAVKKKRAKTAPPQLSELFTPANRRYTLSGFLMALIALIAWWSCNAFIPIVAMGLAQESAKLHSLDRAAVAALGEQWKVTATNGFNMGGLIGALLTVPIAKRWGCRRMYDIYFAASAVSLFAAFGLNLPPHLRLLMYFPVGLTVFGVFGSFAYYLPSLFRPRLQATGAGFCYNAGRVIAAIGPFLVGHIASQGANALSSALTALFWVGFVPIAGLLVRRWVIEKRSCCRWSIAVRPHRSPRLTGVSRDRRRVRASHNAADAALYFPTASRAPVPRHFPTPAALPRSIGL